MPLYMDIHNVDTDEFSAEDVVKAHMEDLAIQDQFGVKQLKYWVNEQAKTIFCLMDGPNKKACNEVHLQSHGGTACNIIEVSDNEYQLFMGQGTDINDLAQTDSGELDSGFRTILLANIICLYRNNGSFVEQIQKLINEHKGVIVREPDNQIMASFVYATDAIMCASLIKNLLDSDHDTLEFNLAVISGKPVDEESETFFEETKSKINSLCSLGLNKRMFLDKDTIALADKELSDQKEKQNNFTLINSEDIQFSIDLSEVISDNFVRSEFNSENLITLLGLSKSSASRKIKSLTGMAPNQLIQETRFQKAINYMVQSNKTIAEIAYESGFNSPTYFTRAFKKRFRVSPTDFAKQQS